MGRDLPFDRDFGPESAFGPRSSILRDELAPGEAVVWEGRPRVGTLILRSLPTSFFGLFFFGFVAVWIFLASHSVEGGWMSVFAIPLLVIGAGMVLAPLWAALGAGRTRYAVTDRRVVLCEPSGLGIRIRSYSPAALANIVRTRRWDGSGDLIFEEVRTRGAQGRDRVTQRGFRAIPDVRRVEALIRSTLLGEHP